MRYRRKSFALALAIGTCASLAAAAGLRGGRGRLPPPKPRGPASRPTASEQAIASRFEAIRAQNEDLEFPELLKRLKIARRPDARPGFDPTRVAYYDQINKALALTPEEQSIYARTGIVGVDHGQRTTMANAYLGIYHRDLPVLITTDSILHAMHRSFDTILMQIEMNFLAPTMKKLLAETRTAFNAEVGMFADPQVRKSAADVDLYLTVALNLLEGNSFTPLCEKAEAGQGGACAWPGEASEPAGLRTHSAMDQDAKVEQVLRAIAAGVESQDVSLYGRDRVIIDWSQFKPRGHYTKWPPLRGYFRAMMWLGRVDVGFNLAPPSLAFGRADAEREFRDAVLLSLLIRRSGQEDALAAVDRAVGFLVGLSDNTTVAEILAAAGQAGAKTAADLARPELLGAIAKAVAGKGQRIRSQIGGRPPGGAAEIPLPDVFQLFGQRFVIDSFITSKVVFDSILYQGKREERMMPSGLDVMAALGNDEAVALLQPEMTKHPYAANLLAARQIVEARPAAVWDATQYDLWLSALTKLDDIPRGAFPEVMRSRAWARKQLQTQLGSWAELRHDTILYAKQSYTRGSSANTRPATSSRTRCSTSASRCSPIRPGHGWRASICRTRSTSRRSWNDSRPRCEAGRHGAEGAGRAAVRRRREALHQGDHQEGAARRRLRRPDDRLHGLVPRAHLRRGGGVGADDRGRSHRRRRRAGSGRRRRRLRCRGDRQPPRSGRVRRSHLFVLRVHVGRTSDRRAVAGADHGGKAAAAAGVGARVPGEAQAAKPAPHQQVGRVNCARGDRRARDRGVHQAGAAVKTGTDHCRVST